jgi:hypothetical protein
MTFTTALFVDLAQAARSPRAAATPTNRAAHANRAAYASRAATDPDATEPATTAASAATEPETATTTAATAAAAPATSATTTSSGFLHASAHVFLIENIERGETDIDHFLFAENEALLRRGIVRLRDTGSGHRGCGCTTHQRKTQPGGTQHLHGGGFGCAFLLRSLLDPCHDRSSVSSCEIARQARVSAKPALPCPKRQTTSSSSTPLDGHSAANTFMCQP